MSGLIPASNHSYAIVPTRLNFSQREVSRPLSQSSQFSFSDTFMRIGKPEPLFSGKKKKGPGFLEQMSHATYGRQIAAAQQKIKARQDKAVETAIEETVQTVTRDAQNEYRPQIQALQTANTRLAEEKEEQYALGEQAAKDRVMLLTPDSHLAYVKDHFFFAHDKHQLRELKRLQDANRADRDQQPAITFERLAQDPTSFIGKPEYYRYPEPMMPSILAPTPIPLQQGSIMEELTSGFKRLTAGSHHSTPSHAEVTVEVDSSGNEDSELEDAQPLPPLKSKRSSTSRRHSHSQSQIEDSSGDDAPIVRNKHRQRRKSTSNVPSVASSSRWSKVKLGDPTTYPVIDYTEDGETIHKRKGSTFWHLVDKRGEWVGELTEYRDRRGKLHVNHARLDEISEEERAANEDAADSSPEEIVEVIEVPGKSKRHSTWSHTGPADQYVEVRRFERPKRNSTWG